MKNDKRGKEKDDRNTSLLLTIFLSVLHELLNEQF